MEKDANKIKTYPIRDILSGISPNNTKPIKAVKIT